MIFYFFFKDDGYHGCERQLQREREINIHMYESIYDNKFKYIHTVLTELKYDDKSMKLVKEGYQHCRFFFLLRMGRHASTRMARTDVSVVEGITVSTVPCKPTTAPQRQPQHCVAVMGCVFPRREASILTPAFVMR